MSGGQFGKLYGCPVDGQIYAQPLYVSSVAIPNQGTFDVVYVATENDSVYAFDADADSCEVLWQASFIDPAAGVTSVPASDLGQQQDIVPEIGITGTPVIDPATATLYVVAKTEENGAYVQRVHALDLTTGAEKFGAPVVIQAKVSGSGDGTQSGQVSFDPLHENQRSALLLAGGKCLCGLRFLRGHRPGSWLAIGLQCREPDSRLPRLFSIARPMAPAAESGRAAPRPRTTATEIFLSPRRMARLTPERAAPTLPKACCA